MSSLKNSVKKTLQESRFWPQINAGLTRAGLKSALASLSESSKLNFTKTEPKENSSLSALSPTPQGSVVELNLQSYENKNWRKHFASSLSGLGLEIGPLHRPLEKHSKMDVKYIDRMSVKELREHYPELKDLPLVEPDIIGDAETLSTAQDNTYDFLISAHVIEHMKSPILSIENWLRVLKPGGMLYLIVPDKRTIFDSTRVRTSLEHLILDYYKPSSERDFEHYLDYALHVHGNTKRDALADAEKLIEEDYSIHFHVFIPTDILNVVNWVDKNVSPVKILEGPSLSPGSDEFHFLLQKV